uniref:Protein TsetseEP domain-containing protein n=1 Tax=Musca domestica TaxID=7370 RepID=A0A1I8MAZ4_MUSDO
MLKTLFLIGIIFLKSMCFGRTNLVNTIIKTTQFSDGSSVDCFAWYLPKINEVANTYELAYLQCLNEANVERQALNDDVLSDREQLDNDAEQICNLYGNCGREGEFLEDFFDCYANVSREVQTTTDTMESLSYKNIQHLKLNYEIIMYNQNNCTDACSNVYVQETTGLYAELQACLSGEVYTTSELPSTEDLTTETTTEEVTRTTETYAMETTSSTATPPPPPPTPPTLQPNITPPNNITPIEPEIVTTPAAPTHPTPTTPKSTESPFPTPPNVGSFLIQ